MDHKYEVVKTLPLGKSIQGELIINAVQKLAKDDLGGTYWQNPRIIDDRTLVQIGRASISPMDDLFIYVDREFQPEESNLFSETYIDPEAYYAFVAVVYHPWPGMKHTVGYGIKSIAESMENFRNKLAVELKVRRP